MSKVSFENMDGQIWVNGDMVAWQQAHVHILTHALHYGTSVFEGVRIYDGHVFKMTEHNQRLIKSAELLDMKVPYSVEELNQATLAILQANNISNGYIRPLAWTGSETMGISTKNTSSTHVAIAVWEWPSYFTPEERLQGITLKTSPWRRPAPNTAPTEAKASGLYMICTLSKHQAEAAGYTDALMLDYRDYVAEATGANIFLVMDGKLHTPTPDCFLNGITRQTVIELAQSRGIDVIERHILPEELANASEVFVTGTAAEITPVRQIDNFHYQPADITKMLLTDYDNLVRGKFAAAVAE